MGGGFMRVNVIMPATEESRLALEKAVASAHAAGIAKYIESLKCGEEGKARLLLYLRKKTEQTEKK